NKYNASISIFVVSIFVLPIRINNYSVILQCFSQGKKILWGSIMDILLAALLMIVLRPFLGTQGIALAIVIATWFQVIYYLWHSKSILKIPITQLVPVKNLLMKFLLLFVIYLLLFLLLQKLSIVISLSIAAVVTTVAIIAGMWSYIKPLLNKNYGENP
ncbi:MAG: polysaccharide biosynthesis C-terminal domain-containing protein, partial [Ginsengibacter sp.]